MNDTSTQPQDPFSPDKRGGEFVIFDLEFTAWEGSLERGWSEPWEAREIIQIGAVRVKDDATLTEVGRLVMLVTPVKNPQLSDYIMALTGIDQTAIDDEGFDFEEALDVFMDFCEGARAILSYSGDPDVLVENCKLHGVKAPKWARFADICGILGKRAGPEFATSHSNQLPKLVGLEPDGKAHDALDDSLAILSTLRVLRNRGVL
ncbi:MAG: exonuclease domain-containing protein [Alphaproteobacteria bacterium]|nr:exonuclease domain-containing protein [Alphaproteobacteria bacterium]